MCDRMSHASRAYLIVSSIGGVIGKRTVMSHFPVSCKGHWSGADMAGFPGLRLLTATSSCICRGWN